MSKFLITSFPMTNDNVLDLGYTAGSLATSVNGHFDDTATGLATVPGGIVGPHGGIDTLAGDLAHPPAFLTGCTVSHQTSTNNTMNTQPETLPTNPTSVAGQLTMPVCTHLLSPETIAVIERWVRR